MIDRGGANRGHQGTGVQGGFDSAAGNEEYVLVVYGNISNLATQKLLKIYVLLLETGFGTTQKSGFITAPKVVQMTKKSIPKR